jgi:hypothetical protein
MTTEDTLFTRIQAAAYLSEKHKLKTSPKSLAKYVVTGGGPRYRKHGSRAIYTQTHLDEYAASKITEPRKSTSERTAKGQPEQGDIEHAMTARTEQ